jgi:hypothetical protein
MISDNTQAKPLDKTTVMRGFFILRCSQYSFIIYSRITHGIVFHSCHKGYLNFSKIAHLLDEDEYKDLDTKENILFAKKLVEEKKVDSVQDFIDSLIFKPSKADKFENASFELI